MTAFFENIITAARRATVFAFAFALILFCQFIPAIGIAGAQSPAASSSLQDFLACQEIKKRKARYKCYDALERADAPATVPPAAAMPSATAAPPTAAAAPVSAPPAAAVPQATTASPVMDEAAERRDFGLPESKRERKGPETLMVHIVSATLGQSGKWTFRTSDGQIWRQTNAKRVVFRSQSFQAEISRAPLSGFYFRPADQKLRLRVKRIR